MFFEALSNLDILTGMNKNIFVFGRKKPTEKIINLLASHENELYELYILYSTKYPNYKKFWLHIAQEEANHHRMLQSLLKLWKDGKVAIYPNRFKTEQLKDSISLINSYKKQSSMKELGINQAFHNTLRLESGMIENKFFTYFEADSPKVKELLEKIKVDTERHKEQIENLIQQLRQ